MRKWKPSEDLRFILEPFIGNSERNSRLRYSLLELKQKKARKQNLCALFLKYEAKTVRKTLSEVNLSRK